VLVPGTQDPAVELVDNYAAWENVGDAWCLRLYWVYGYVAEYDLCDGSGKLVVFQGFYEVSSLYPNSCGESASPGDGVPMTGGGSITVANPADGTGGAPAVPPGWGPPNCFAVCTGLIPGVLPSPPGLPPVAHPYPGSPSVAVPVTGAGVVFVNDPSPLVSYQGWSQAPCFLSSFQSGVNSDVGLVATSCLDCETLILYKGTAPNGTPVHCVGVNHDGTFNSKFGAGSYSPSATFQEAFQGYIGGLQADGVPYYFLCFHRSVR
jgi:hypothetical protein